MPNRISAWGVYDVFTVKNGEQIFLAAVSDAQWAVFCDVLGFADLKADPRYSDNNARVSLACRADARVAPPLGGLHRRRVDGHF
jgi:crotonobetainyl-CoA:carnitine CoA-transferase CaiB-like acyl-CoA transferase